MKSFIPVALASLAALAAAAPSPLNDGKQHGGVIHPTEQPCDDAKDGGYKGGKEHWEHKPKHDKPKYEHHKGDGHKDKKEWHAGKHVDECKEAKHMPEGLNSFPFHFTSKFFAKATPDTIINNNGSSVPGLEGAVGYYSFGVNAYTELICYNITLVGVTGDYQSPAATATHIHQAPAGSAGPPRISFPNPQPDASTGRSDVRTSFGCLQGPFETGLDGPDGNDTGAGFSLYKLEANPSGFFADVHTAERPAGAVRGQIGQVWWSE